MELILLFVSVFILIIAVFLFLKRPQSASGVDLKEFNDTKTALAVSQQMVISGKEEKLGNERNFLERIQGLENERNELIHQLTNEKQKNARNEEAINAQEQRFLDQKAFVEASQTRFKTEFENVANLVLKAKTAEFTEVNKANLDLLLNPLKENIKAFEEKVEKVYKSESDERNVLKGEITKMMELNKQISDDASNLTKALKGDNKKQGNWGEMVLDKLLEGSGLIEGTNYSKQNGFIADDGNRLLPDVVIFLPEEKHIVIDAKVSLVAYEKLVSCEDEEREDLIKQHINSIKTHITGLSGKNYHDLYQINSPEFVLLFIPIESSFAIAVQHDQDLFDFAWNKRVVIVTPSTLLATLKTVASIWKQEQQSKNALDIATKAGQLYDKFVGFVIDLQKVGDSIDKSQKAYGDAMGKLSTGNGNLIGKVENLRKLGAKATKEIDSRLLEE